MSPPKNNTSSSLGYHKEDVPPLKIDLLKLWLPHVKVQLVFVRMDRMIYEKEINNRIEQENQLEIHQLQQKIKHLEFENECLLGKGNKYVFVRMDRMIYEQEINNQIQQENQSEIHLLQQKIKRLEFENECLLGKESEHDIYQLQQKLQDLDFENYCLVKRLRRTERYYRRVDLQTYRRCQAIQNDWCNDDTSSESSWETSDPESTITDKRQLSDFTGLMKVDPQPQYRVRLY